jgi:hypothetical protein
MNLSRVVDSSHGGYNNRNVEKEYEQVSHLNASDNFIKLVSKR